MHRPRLIVIFGLIASGKTTLARALGQNQGWPVVHSDLVRKALVGIPATRRVQVPYGQGIYAPDISGRTYQEMFHQARELLQTGRSVILEGSFMRAPDRQQARELATACGAPVFFILCSCPAEETLRRLARRALNHQAVSNGRQEILATQLRLFEPVTDLPEVPVLILDTNRPLEEILMETISFLTPDEHNVECNVVQEEIIARVKQQAVNNFKSGLNCAESVFTAILAELDTDLPPEIMCLVTGFGSGGGLFGGTCGSLNGAIAALGLVYGRRQLPGGTPEEKKAQLYGNPGIYRIFNRLSNVFQDQYGTTQCREITKPWHGEWFTRDRLKTCLGTVAFMAEKAAEMVFPADKDRWGSHPLGENLLGEKE